MTSKSVSALLLLVALGCTSYTVRSVPINNAATYTHQESVGGLVVAADVYNTEDKYVSVFDTIPSYERGYIGINLLFFNDTDQAFSVASDGVKARTVSGAQLDVIPAGLVAEHVLRSTTGRYAATGIIGGISSAGANEKIRQDFESKGLKEIRVGPGIRAQGFVFFTNEEQISNLLISGIRNEGTGNLLTVEIPMPEIPLYFQ